MLVLAWVFPWKQTLGFYAHSLIWEVISGNRYKRLKELNREGGNANIRIKYWVLSTVSRWDGTLLESFGTLKQKKPKSCYTRWIREGTICLLALMLVKDGHVVCNSVELSILFLYVSAEHFLRQRNLRAERNEQCSSTKVLSSITPGASCSKSSNIYRKMHWTCMKWG